MSNTTTDPDSLFTPEDFLNLTIEHITEYSDEQIAELRRVLDKLPRLRREQQEWLRQDWQGYKMTTDQNTTTRRYIPIPWLPMFPRKPKEEEINDA